MNEIESIIVGVVMVLSGSATFIGILINLAEYLTHERFDRKLLKGLFISLFVLSVSLLLFLLDCNVL